MMKKRVLRVGILFYLLLAGYTSTVGALVEKLEEAGSKLRSSGDQIFLGVVEEKKQQLAGLKKSLELFDEETRKNAVLLKEDADRVSGRLTVIKSEFKQNPEDEFYGKQLFVLNETYQILQDIIRSKGQVHIVLELFIKEVKAFLEDPDFEGYKAEHRLQERLYYTFEDLQKMNQRMIEQEKRVTHLLDQEKNAKMELVGLKRTMTIATELLKKKQVDLADLVASIEQQDESFAFETERNIALARDQEQQYRYRIVLDEIMAKEIEYKVGLYAHQSFIAKSHLVLFKEYARKIKPAVRVSEADIAYAKDELTKWKQEYYKTKEGYRQDIDKLQEELKKKEKRRDAISAELSVSLGRELDDFSKDPAQTVDAYLSFCEVARINVETLLIKSKIELIEAHIALEDEKFQYESLQIDVKESYYKISTRKLTSDDEIIQETKKYVAPFAEAKSKALRYKEKIVRIGDSLSAQKGVIDAIARRRQELMQLKKTIFKLNPKEYVQCLDLLGQSEKTIKDQIDVLSKLTGVYSGVTSIVGNNSRLIDFIKTELEAITIWYRPEYAISWQATRTIPSDIALFFSDIRSYVGRLDGDLISSQLKDLFRHPLYLLLFLLKACVLFWVLLICKRYVPLLADFLMRISRGTEGIVRSVLLIFSLFLEFVHRVFWGVALWSCMYIFLQLKMIPDPYVYVLFYLCSIPYLLMIAYLFTQFLIQFNENNEYALLLKSFQRRFLLVFSALVYSTIVITLFREAFMLTNYYKSELPRVLLALNFIIQVILIFFVIPKDQLLEMIPATNGTWRWIGREVAKYYYLLLFFAFSIIILGSPYIGHFRLIEYMFFALIKTVIMLTGLLVLYTLFKRVIYRIFFIADKEVARERFAKSKTWFGLLIIALLVCITIFGIFIGAHIWGWPVHVSDMLSWLDEPISGIGSPNPITVNSFLRVIGFIFAGFAVSYALNRFVFDKIFDLLLVDMGVQHTVTRIMHYVVVIVAVFIGFQNVGLGDMIKWILGALALSLGWVLKEPISDFVAYFIILVQRPLKIGDYVKITEEMQGVVRKITPRSVILRRKNSTTIVIPNSTITTNHVINWNYTRSFIALTDIELVISFKEDPARVLELLRQVLESHPNILKTPPVVVRLEEFLTYGYRFMVRGFVSSVYTLEMWNIASDVRVAIVKKLRENNIEIAIPVRRVQSSVADGSDRNSA
ncbi:MAG: mechanosensitive ion channel [Candidatus Dependentiae bacterium]|nr:mechanosensitive ion channel [Candidatus Dependentiae bacterium]